MQKDKMCLNVKRTLNYTMEYYWVKKSIKRCDILLRNKIVSFIKASRKGHFQQYFAENSKDITEINTFTIYIYYIGACACN